MIQHIRKIRYAGINMQGQRVLACECSCSWVHMTVHKRFKKRRAKKYLEARYKDHVKINL